MLTDKCLLSETKSGLQSQQTQKYNRMCSERGLNLLKHHEIEIKNYF